MSAQQGVRLAERTTFSNRLAGSKGRDVSDWTRSHRMRTDNNSLSTGSGGEEKTHTEERQ